MSSSPVPTISSDDPAPGNNDVSVVARQALNPLSRSFFPHSPSTRNYYFSAPPPFYFFSASNLPPPPSIWVYYPLWYLNPSPNRFESTQELPPLCSPNPSQVLCQPPKSRRRVFGRKSYGQWKKVTWKKKIKHQVDSNGNHITTVMLRNLPNRYTREMMTEYMDTFCKEENEKQKDEELQISYDFIYLPMDFRTTMNKGYAFVNFTNTKAVSKFKDACDHKPWCRFKSRKVLEITPARIQGKDELVKHFQHMTYPTEAYSAVCFNPARSGLENTVQTTMVGKCTKPVSSV